MRNKGLTAFLLILTAAVVIAAAVFCVGKLGKHEAVPISGVQKNNDTAADDKASSN